MEQNPIYERVGKLRDQWVDFTVEEAPLLKWNLKIDELQILETFLLIESDEAGELPDLLFYFREPFIDDNSYCSSFVEYFEAKVKELLYDESDSEPFIWNKPSVNPDESEQEYLFRVLQSLSLQLEGLVETLGVILEPADVQKPQKWVQWLYNWTLISQDQDAIKVAFIDYSSGSIYNHLLEEAENSIMVTDANLNMHEALNELAEELDDGGPGGAYRKEFISMMNFISDGNLDKATTAGSNAISIAGKQNWFNLQIPIFMALAGANLGADHVVEAYDLYSNAESAADEAINADIAEGAKLKISAIFGACSILMTTKQYAMAAERYLDAASAAEAHDDTLNQIEALRMATVAYDKAKKRKNAWELGNHALELVDFLKDDEKEQVLIDQLGLTLWNITKKITFRRHRSNLEERMTELCGEEWKAEAEGALS